MSAEFRGTRCYVATDVNRKGRLYRLSAVGYKHTEISIPALATVLRVGGHSPSALWMILKRGRDPFVRYAFHQFPQRAVRPAVEEKGVEKYVSRFAVGSPPKRYFAKRRIFSRAVNQLLEKGVRVIVVDVPIHDLVREVLQASVYESLGEALRRDLGPRAVVMTDIEIPSDPNPFFDLSHLNARGQRHLTELLVPVLRAVDSEPEPRADTRRSNPGPLEHP